MIRIHRIPLFLAVAALCAACTRDAEPDAESPPSADTPSALTRQAPGPMPPDSPAAASDASAVVVRYEHLRTCVRFMGREGQFFVYRVTSVENRGGAPFELEPANFRVGGEAGGAPALRVPEFSNLGPVEPGATASEEELYLLERTDVGLPPRGPVPLGYAAPGVEMARGAAAPAYDEATGCDELNT